MKVDYIKSLEKEFKFYNYQIKELMDLVFNNIKENIELIIFDNIPLVQEEDIISAYQKGINSFSSVRLFYKDIKIGEIKINNEKYIDYESENFIPLSDAYFYEEIFKKYNKRIIEKHRKRGVIFINSDDVYISPFVEIDENNYILNGVSLLGITKIGKNNIIGPYSSLENFICGCYNNISWFVGKNSSIGDNNTLGPFSHFRNDVTIMDGNVIGNFNELKSTQMGSSNRMKHLSYLGNTKVANHVNFGCGVITANYDGKNKHQTIIEDEVFIGCNSVLVAPLNVGSKSFVAAQSIVNENLEEFDFAIGRAKQTTKKQYMKK